MDTDPKIDPAEASPHITCDAILSGIHWLRVGSRVVRDVLMHPKAPVDPVMTGVVDGMNEIETQLAKDLRAAYGRYADALSACECVQECDIQITEALHPFIFGEDA